MSSSAARADIEKDISKLSPKSFCINADLETAWEETAHVLRRMEIPPTLADHDHYVVTTAFVFADYGKLFKISSNPRPFLKGRFTLKMTLTQEAPSYTKLNIVLQVR